MAENKEYEVVSIGALSDTHVRLGLAPSGRIATASRQAGPADMAMRGVVGAEMYIDWDITDVPSIGEVMTASYTRSGAIA